MNKDLYQILGVSETATADELRKAYRDLAKKYHPDANQGDAAAEERFKAISDAYDVLGNPEKREQYDQMRRRGHDPFAGAAGTDGFADLSDILRSMFGGGRDPFGGMQEQGRGTSQVEIEIPFVTAAKGGTVERVLHIPVSCTTCSGAGGTGRETCASCGGSGRAPGGHSFFAAFQPCANCGGKGYTIKKMCETCKGSGSVQGRENLSLWIPPGISDGATLRTSAGGSPLIVHVRVSPDRFFSRMGKDILCSVTVTAAQAVLGASLMVRTLDGRVKLKIPAGTQPGSVLRLRGKGIAVAGGKGDQLVTVNVVLPGELTAEQRKIWEQLRDGAS